MIKNLDRLDEGALTTLNSWVLKVQDDKGTYVSSLPPSLPPCFLPTYSPLPPSPPPSFPDNAAMTEVLQKVFQFYAGGVLMRAKGYDRTGSDGEGGRREGGREGGEGGEGGRECERAYHCKANTAIIDENQQPNHALPPSLPPSLPPYLKHGTQITPPSLPPSLRQPGPWSSSGTC